MVYVDQLDLPIAFPNIGGDAAGDMLANLQYARAQGWLSSQTGASMLGLDLLQDFEQLANEQDKAMDDTRAW